MLDEINMYLSITALALGIISFISSLFFYDKSKESEIRNNKILNDINSATNTLNTVSNKILFKTIESITGTSHKLIDNITKSAITENKAEISNKQHSQILALYSYILKTNLLAKIIWIDNKDETYTELAELISEQSYNDYQKINKIISEIDVKELSNSENYQTYNKDKNTYSKIIEAKLTDIIR